MKQEQVVQLALWSFIGLGLAFAAVMLVNALAGGNVNASLVGLSTIETGTTGQGDVSIALTPRSIENGVLSFDMAINTHSVDLSGADLTQLAVLEYGNTAVTPVTTPTLGGHHINGVLAFPVGRVPSGFTVRIAGIPKTPERVYTW